MAEDLRVLSLSRVKTAFLRTSGMWNWREAGCFSSDLRTNKRICQSSCPYHKSRVLGKK